MKKTIIGLFLSIIMIPLLFTSISEVVNIKLDTTLQGNFDTVENPNGGVILPTQWFSGQDQSEYNNYFNNTFVPRGYMLKTYNQLRYSLFDEGNRIVGKDGSIFETSYLYDALVLSDAYNFSLSENQEKMKAYVNQLESIHHKLEAVDKQLIVYTTPSKAVFNVDEISDRYLNEKVEAERAIDVFNAYIADTDVVYFNSTEYLQQFTDEEWPVFYKTGIHWSRPAEQLVSKEIFDLIGEQQNRTGRTISIDELQVSSNAYWRDNDVYELLNIYTGKEPENYYQFDTQMIMPNEYKEYSVLLQGGSFGEGLKKDFIENRIGYQFNDIFYKTMWRDTNGTMTQILEWSDLPLQQLLDKADIIIIEVNEAVLANYSNGFVAYLDQFLDAYIPQEIEKTYMQNLDCSLETIYPEATVRGLYAVENGYCWSDKYAMLQLKNSMIAQKGLTIEFTLPQYLADVSGEMDTVKVYINGELKETVSLKNVGHKIITLKPDEIVSKNDVYTIELNSSKAFIPAELDINADTRSLAILVQYIGEAR